jgi:HlyD family secretion protein
VSTDIFRKAALERLSSPDQLDEALRVTSAHTWLALSGLLLLLATASVWAWQGRIATTVDGKGIFVRRGGVYNVSSRSAGLIADFKVRAGDSVRENQVLARIVQPELQAQIRTAKQVLDMARSERDRTLAIRAKTSIAARDALKRKRATYERQIETLENEIEVAKEQAVSRLSLEGQLENAKAELTQVEVQEISEQQQTAQATVELQNRVAEAELRLAGLEEELRASSDVVSPYAGEVLELKAEVGSNVQPGTPLLSVQPAADTFELLLYLPALQAKRVKAGMRVEISPTTVKREESGYMPGTVTYVSDYPATEAALMRNVQNEVLVRSLIHDGPVTEARAQLVPDRSAPSGYQWSSGRGPAIGISGGTICLAGVVTKRQAPIELIIPYIKSRTGLD